MSERSKNSMKTNFPANAINERRHSNFVNLKIIQRDGRHCFINARVGNTVLEEAMASGIDIEAVCDGNLECTTCHVIMKSDEYASIKEPSEEEKDMLAIAHGLKPTSRLACQLIVECKMNNWSFAVATPDMIL
ncbi:hypothetical protein GJ496_003700 [Pomphorhynchus laevis]|nr:hypothetical protein GJ496_003700 [Pomphorhynchus laevis]